MVVVGIAHLDQHLAIYAWQGCQDMSKTTGFLVNCAIMASCDALANRAIMANRGIMANRNVMA